VLPALLACLIAAPIAARADTSKLAKEDVPLQDTMVMRGKDKRCCGYPLVDQLGWALRFYWLSFESEYDGPGPIERTKPGSKKKISPSSFVEIYTPEGFFFGRISELFASRMKLEGTGLLDDGRLVNYAGPCAWGYGTCFEEIDRREYPFGRGAGTRPLVPFKSVAVDPRVVPIGEPLYIPEFDGMVLPDGSIHDGCVRADDTGGGIKKRKMDFFVVTYGNFRFLLDELLNVTWITPQIQAPRCQYLRDP
jgi:3D (Asp-Asp-Asp) domain-containing protein